jgi:hypothetical protein
MDFLAYEQIRKSSTIHETPKNRYKLAGSLLLQIIFSSHHQSADSTSLQSSIYLLRQYRFSSNTSIHFNLRNTNTFVKGLAISKV